MANLKSSQRNSSLTEYFIVALIEIVYFIYKFTSNIDGLSYDIV